MTIPQQRQSEQVSRYEEHVRIARSHTAKANEYRELASARRAKLHRETISATEFAASKGNQLSKALLREPLKLETITDTRCSGDAVWKSHVANNQWYIKQSLMESNMAQMELLYSQVTQKE
jgi:hypothetical protein